MLFERRKNPLFTLLELNGSSFEQTWIPFDQGCFEPNLAEISRVVLEKKLNFVNVFSLFRYNPSLEKGGVLHLNKLESPSPTDALSQVWLKLAQWFRRRFFVNVFSLFGNYVLLEMGKALHLNTFEFPLPKHHALCQVWLKLAHACAVFQLKKMKMLKVYDNDNNNDNDDDNNDDGQWTNCDQKSSLELRLRWAKNYHWSWHLISGLLSLQS